MSGGSQRWENPCHGTSDPAFADAAGLVPKVLQGEHDPLDRLPVQASADRSPAAVACSGVRNREIEETALQRPAMPLTSGYAVDQVLVCPSAAEVRTVADPTGGCRRILEGK